MPFMTSGQQMEQALFLQPQSPHGAVLFPYRYILYLNILHHM